MPKFAYKIFNQGSNTLLAISDAGIIGKTIGTKEIELTVSKEFYSEKSCDEKDIPRLVSSATIVNAIGKEIISLLLKNGFINDKNILYVGEVPHAQIITI